MKIIKSSQYDVRFSGILKLCVCVNTHRMYRKRISIYDNRIDDDFLVENTESESVKRRTVHHQSMTHRFLSRKLLSKHKCNTCIACSIGSCLRFDLANDTHTYSWQSRLYIFVCVCVFFFFLFEMCASIHNIKPYYWVLLQRKQHTNNYIYISS